MKNRRRGFFGHHDFRIGTYINGNYFVQSDWTGTKVKRTLRVGEDFNPDFPDSIDLKITNSCSHACPFCHEDSKPGGKSFNLENTKRVLSELPRVGIELAVGGGNVLDIPDQTVHLLKWAIEQGFQPRVTVNWKDFEEQKVKDTVASIEKYEASAYPDLEELLKISDIMGVSTNHYIEDPYIEKEKQLWRLRTTTYVWHVIVGILPVEDLVSMFNDPKAYQRILILGFKQFGRAKDQEIKHLDEWKEAVRRLLWESRHVLGEKKPIIGFDNLAIEQLELQDCMLKKEWDTMYFGDEFSSSMYVDAVEETFAPTSRSAERTSWSETGIVDYFKTRKHEFIHSK